MTAIDEQRRIVHAFEVKWAKVGVKDVKRYARELRLKIAKTPFSDWSYKLHIVVRDVEAEEEAESVEEDTILHTLWSMPFKCG